MTVSLEEARLRIATELMTLAKRDYDAMVVLFADKSIDFAIIGFHAQQTIEKAMKAVMAIKGITFPRTHDLMFLNQLLLDAQIKCPLSEATLIAINPFAVSSRYNLETDELLSSSEAIEAAKTCLQWARQQIN